MRVPTWDVLTPGASEAPSTHTGSTFRVTKSLVITVTEKLTVRTILSLLAHWRTNKSHYFFSDCLVIIHVLKLSIFLKATNIKSDGIKFSREKGWGAIEYKKKNWYKIFVIMIQEEFFTRDTNYSCNWPPSVQQGRSTPLSHDHSGRSHTDTPLYTEIHRTLVNTLKFKSLIIVTKSSGTCNLWRYIQSSTVL